MKNKWESYESHSEWFVEGQERTIGEMNRGLTEQEATEICRVLNQLNDAEKRNISFSDFWDAYDKKVDKKKSRQRWNKLSKLDRQAIMAFIPQYKKFQPQKQYRKYPSTFLNNRSWEDEEILNFQPKSNRHDRSKPKQPESRIQRFIRRGQEVLADFPDEHAGDDQNQKGGRWAGSPN